MYSEMLSLEPQRPTPPLFKAIIDEFKKKVWDKTKIRNLLGDSKASAGSKGQDSAQQIINFQEQSTSKTLLHYLVENSIANSRVDLHKRRNLSFVKNNEESPRRKLAE